MTKTFAARSSDARSEGFTPGGGPLPRTASGDLDDAQRPHAPGLPSWPAPAATGTPMDRALARFEAAAVAFVEVARAAGVAPLERPARPLAPDIAGTVPDPGHRASATAAPRAVAQASLEPARNVTAATQRLEPSREMHVNARPERPVTVGPASGSRGFAALRHHAVAFGVLLLATGLAAVLTPWVLHRPGSGRTPTLAPLSPAVAAPAQAPPPSDAAPARDTRTAPIATQDTHPLHPPSLPMPGLPSASVAAKATPPSSMTRPRSTAVKPVDVAAAIAAAQARADRFLAAGDARANTVDDPIHAK